jgi:peroxiredoxin
VVLAVNIGEQATPIHTFQQQYEVSFPLLLDPLLQVATLYGVQATPTHFLLNPQGQVIAGGMGDKDWAGEEARRLIDQLLTAQQTPANPRHPCAAKAINPCAGQKP